ncbi:hypothetical protein FDA94_30390 [Herbidospora galbida]|uniref:CATRA-Associated Small Protein domain-containing protein n=1 Tax=Herbidospora galbida TaxID=2575442 RepID=A0A4U3M5S0_9ACTN|nr:CATRA system-associated protein [Herbidospora galbida]TKK84235.1 hypothetical protein FDA94_30390 [Herbidospora galbida]
MHDDAVDLLRRSLKWSLPATGWAAVDAAVRTLAASDDVAADLGYLELAGPARIVTRFGDPPEIPMPAELRDRVNELIHKLGAAEPEPADDAP